MPEGIEELRQQGNTLHETVQGLLDDADRTQVFLRQKLTQDEPWWVIDREKITEISLLLDSLRTLASLYMEGLNLLERMGLGESRESTRQSDV